MFNAALRKMKMAMAAIIETSAKRAAIIAARWRVKNGGGEKQQHRNRKQAKTGAALAALSMAPRQRRASNSVAASAWRWRHALLCEIWRATAGQRTDMVEQSATSFSDIMNGGAWAAQTASVLTSHRAFIKIVTLRSHLHLRLRVA